MTYKIEIFGSLRALFPQILLREKRLSPRRAPKRSLLPLSPRRTQVLLLSIRKFPSPELTRTSTAGRAPAAHGYGAGNLDVRTTDGGRGTGDFLRPCTHKPVGVTRRRLRPLCLVSDQARAAAQNVAKGQKRTLPCRSSICREHNRPTLRLKVQRLAAHRKASRTSSMASIGFCRWGKCPMPGRRVSFARTRSANSTPISLLM
jgi:hypothetical protein